MLAAIVLVIAVVVGLLITAKLFSLLISIWAEQRHALCERDLRPQQVKLSSLMVIGIYDGDSPICTAVLIRDNMALTAQTGLTAGDILQARSIRNNCLSDAGPSQSLLYQSLSTWLCCSA